MRMNTAFGERYCIINMKMMKNCNVNQWWSSGRKITHEGSIQEVLVYHGWRVEEWFLRSTSWQHNITCISQSISLLQNNAVEKKLAKSTPLLILCHSNCLLPAFLWSLLILKGLIHLRWVFPWGHVDEGISEVGLRCETVLACLSTLSSPAIWFVNPDAPCGITLLNWQEVHYWKSKRWNGICDK